MNQEYKSTGPVFPLSLLVLLIAFTVAYHFAGFPEGDDLIKVFEGYLNRYGYAIVFVAALIEAIPPINFYFPGSAVVVISVALTRDGSLNIFGVLSAAAAAFFISFAFDFLLGKHGLQWLVLRTSFAPALIRAQEKIAKHGPKWIWLANFHPNIGALAAMSCGMLKVPFRIYSAYSAASLLLWVSAWGTVAYFGGKAMLRWLDLRLLIPLLLVLATVEFFRKRRNRKQVRGQP
jgi:membrane protein DedA with SNARE-associated domain